MQSIYKNHLTAVTCSTFGSLKLQIYAKLQNCKVSIASVICVLCVFVDAFARKLQCLRIFLLGLEDTYYTCNYTQRKDKLSKLQFTCYWFIFIFLVRGRCRAGYALDYFCLHDHALKRNYGQLKLVPSSSYILNYDLVPICF